MSDRLANVTMHRGGSSKHTIPAEQLFNSTIDMRSSPNASTMSETQQMPVMLETHTPSASPTQITTQLESFVDEAAVPSSSRLDLFNSDNDAPRSTTSRSSKAPSTSGSSRSSHSQDIKALRSEMRDLRQFVADTFTRLDPQAISQRAPTHCGMKILQRYVSPFEIDDWIRAAQTELHLRPPCPDHVAVNWAVSHVAPEIQKDWRRHLPTILYHRPDTDVKLEEFWRFIRGESREPALYAHSYRGQLEFIHQQESESPKQFFLRWRTHQLRVRPNLNLRGADSVDLAYHYYYRLDEQLQSMLFANHFRLENAEDISNQAEMIWAGWRKDHGQCVCKTMPPNVEPIATDKSHARPRCSNCSRRGHVTADCCYGQHSM